LKKKEVFLRVGAKILEESAYDLDSMKLPLVRKHQTKLETKLLKTSNEMRKMNNRPIKKYELQRPGKNLEIE
jgi:predicted ArsR family transcriptional regulator